MTPTYVPDEAGSRLFYDATDRPETGRPVVYATQGIISSGHYLTSAVGMKMLLQGGNAFDALVAAGFAAAVIEPIASYSLACEGVFMMYHAATGDILSINGQGTAPRQSDIGFYKSQGLDSIPTGPGHLAHLSFTVPGVVDAYIEILERYGTKTIGEVLEPAIHYSEHGVPFYEYMVKSLDSESTIDQFDNYPPGGRDIFYKDGQLPSPGDLMVQKGLANTLKNMVSSEMKSLGNRSDGLRAARSSFYKGEIAEVIVGSSNSVGGLLELDDLSRYKARFEKPVSTTYNNYEIYCQDASTQAPVLLQALNILEDFDLYEMGHNSSQYVHTVSEALKLALADREAYYGDSDFINTPIDGLLSKGYGKERAKLIDAKRAFPALPPHGHPFEYSESTPTAGGFYGPVVGSSLLNSAADFSQGTTHISVLDRYGNMVCVTPSGGAFGKSVFFPELGCTLSTRIEMFNLKEGHPNALEPSKRPRTTLVNYLRTEGDDPIMLVGCPGGDHQAQSNLQLILNTLVFGMNPQEAIEAPRFATNSVTNSFYPHTYNPGELAVEDGFSNNTLDVLSRMGHKIVRVGVCGMGATVMQRNSSTGVMSGGADPRRASYAVGW